MKTRALLTAILVVALASLAVLSAQQAQPAGKAAPAARPAATWYKGNIHTHTIATDGDSTPEEVVRWYREQKYNFLVLSDHNTLIAVDGLNAFYATGELVGADRRSDVPFNPFLLIAGEELSDKFSPASAQPGERDLQSKEIHLGALNVPKAVAPQGGTSVADTIQRDVDAIRAAGGVPVVNHPNFLWAITAGDLKGVKSLRLFEVFNGHMQTHNLGGGGRPSVEAIWDDVLTAGTLLYGVAADDAHAFQKLGLPNPMSAPGRGWIMVRAERLTAPAILAAMERGDFYATTGVELSEVRSDGKTVSVTVKPFSRSKYTVLFIGKGGRVLKEVPLDPVITARTGPLAPTAQAVTYEISGDEGYVRAKVVESNGQMAWTQPVLVPRKE
jgi:hypothetical protein